MYTTYREAAALVFVYIAEAHATDGWQMASNVEEGVLVANHLTIEDRFAAARASVERLGLTMPVLVDAMDDAVSNAFAAWPERIYVAAADGRVVHAGGPGPFDFDPDAASAALDALL